VFLSQVLQKNVKIIVMSGTPINNPQEIYDLCNIMYDGNLEFIRDTQRYRNEVEPKILADPFGFVSATLRKTLFPSRDIPISETHLLRTFTGKVSQFPQGLDTRNIPSLVIKGDQSLVEDSDLKVITLEPSETER